MPQYLGDYPDYASMREAEATERALERHWAERARIQAQPPPRTPPPLTGATEEFWLQDPRYPGWEMFGRSPAGSSVADRVREMERLGGGRRGQQLAVRAVNPARPVHEARRLMYGGVPDLKAAFGQGRMFGAKGEVLPQAERFMGSAGRATPKLLAKGAIGGLIAHLANQLLGDPLGDLFGAIGGRKPPPRVVPPVIRIPTEPIPRRTTWDV